MLPRIVLVLVVAGLVTPAPAAAKPRVVPGKAVPGAAVGLRGVSGGVKGVTVGGRKATLLAGRRFVVPSARPGKRPVVIRTARGRLRTRLRVLPPFRGRFRVVADRAKAKTATIGAAGGTVKAGAAELRIPPKALSSNVAIKLTPLKRIRALPGAGRATGVRMEPAGTTFTKDATLVITLPKKARKPIAGLHGTSKGRDARWAATARPGRTIVIPIRHFSDAFAQAITEAAYAALLASVTTDGYSEHDLENALNALNDYERSVPGSCAAQPLCSQVKAAVAERADELLRSTCLDGYEYGDLDALHRLAFLVLRTGSPRPDVGPCVSVILEFLVAAAAPLARETPHGTSAEAVLQLTEDQYAQADVSGEGLVTRVEWLRFLWVRAVEENAAVATVALVDLLIAVRRMRDDGLALCETDQPQGRARLDAARAVAASTEALPEIEAALAACAVRLTISPAEVTLAPGETRALSFAGRPGETVTWTATAGTITPDGVYTAPAAIGTYTVTATSGQMPGRAAIATVNVRDIAAAWTFLDFYLSSFAGVSGDVSDDVLEGDCALSRPPADTTSWDKTHSCRSTSNRGVGFNETVIDVDQSPAGPEFRRVEVAGSSSSGATWNDMNELTGETGGNGEASYYVEFEVDEPTPWMITGSVGTTVDGGDRLAIASVTLATGGGTPVFECERADVNATTGCNGSGVLEPGEWQYIVLAGTEAEAGLNHTADAGATATASGTLTLNP